MTPTPTPRTDAAEILWNDTGLCVVSAEFARYLERELADKAESLAFQTQLNRELIEREKQTFAELTTERELADRLLAIAEKAVSDHEGTLRCDCDCKCSGRRIANDSAETLTAWKEARHE